MLPPEQRARLIETRRDLHRHPELAYQEVRTAGVVAERLRALGYPLRERVAETGVLAKLGEGGRGVLLRADMDALPIQEEGQASYRSTVPGRMHACGHDGHVASLLTAAERLAASPPAGRVVLCFQPAEEGAGGADRMVAEGALEGVDAAFGVHLWTPLACGKVGVAPGPVMAAVDKFELTVVGVGGHGAMPHEAIDPVVAACHLVTALQTIVSRETDPLDSVVVTVGRLEAGDNFNVIPRTARLWGTCRSYSRAAYEGLPERFRRVAEGVTRAHGCELELDYTRLCPPTVNEPAMTALVQEVVRDLLGPDALVTEGPGARTLAGEDFARYLERVPGCFFFVGARDEPSGKVHPHHSPLFDIDERALEISARLLEETARRFLAR